MGGVSGTSIYYLWWPHAQTPVNGSGGTNYTRGNASPASSRFLLTTPSMVAWENRPTFMRNLECDISPHLLDDPHSLWAFAWGMFFNEPSYGGPVGNDVYATHPWHDAQYFLSTNVHWGRWDNPFLFYNPGTPYPSSPNYWAQPNGRHNVTVGITSPPGCDYNTTDTPPYQSAPPSYWLSGLTLQAFGPFGTYTPAVPNRYGVNALGVGDAGVGCPDELAYYTTFQGVGLRYNCQASFMNALTNLQTFLVVTGPNPAGTGERQQGDSQRLVEMTSLRRAAEIKFRR